MPEETSLDHCVEAQAGVWGPCSLDKATKLNNLPSKKNRKLLRKTKNKTLVETVAKYRVEQTPEKNSDMLCEESV